MTDEEERRTEDQHQRGHQRRKTPTGERESRVQRCYTYEGRPLVECSGLPRVTSMKGSPFFEISGLPRLDEFVCQGLPLG